MDEDQIEAFSFLVWISYNCFKPTFNFIPGIKQTIIIIIDQESME